MLHEGQGLPSWRKLWEEECKSVSSPGGLSRIPALPRLQLELGVGRGRDREEWSLLGCAPDSRELEVLGPQPP